MRVVVSSCGTSLLTNQLASATGDRIRQLLHRHSNSKESEIPVDERQILEAHGRSCRDQLLAGDAKQARKMSAELNGLLGVYEGRLPDPQDILFLLQTDTYLGSVVADAVQAWLTKVGAHSQVVPIEFLATNSVDMFYWGIQELAKWCSETLPGYRQQRYQIVFNLTGGFKGVQGVLNTLGHVYADEIVYIFENSDSLIHIPRLPVRWDLDDRIAENLPILRQLWNHRPVGADQVRAVPDSLVQVVDGSATLSVFGSIAFEQYRKAEQSAYAERLLEPPSGQIVYSRRFQRDANAIREPDRLRLLNLQIDDFDRYLVEHGNYNPRSLRVHPWGGPPPVPGVTHEFYAWSDSDAARVWFHFQPDGTAVLDLFGPHL
ncbi:MAG: putative CRISPR-associated protein [Limnochordaceae bacterium]|nr:putative CRISPR-associated protein [Limnochordaceae bacterium]